MKFALKFLATFIYLLTWSEVSSADVQNRTLPNRLQLVCSDQLKPGFENKKGRFVLLRTKLRTLRKRHKRIINAGRKPTKTKKSLRKWRKELRVSIEICRNQEQDVEPTPTPEPSPLPEAYIELLATVPNTLPTPRSIPDCQDGLDNDDDGFVDYPEDPDCFSENDNFETSKGTPLVECLTVEICANGVDDNCNDETDEASCLVRNARITRNNSSIIDHETLIDDSYAAGLLIDEVNFIDDPGIGNLEEKDGVISGSAYVEWTFNIPTSGDYVLSFMSWANGDRTFEVEYYSFSNPENIITVSGVGRSWFEFYLLHFEEEGQHRIRIHQGDALTGRVNYPKHARLHTVRKDPYQITNIPSQRFVGNLSNFREHANNDWVKWLSSDVIGDANNLVSGGNLNQFSECSSRSNAGKLADLAVAYLLTGNADYVDYAVEALDRVYELPHWFCGPSWSSLSVGEFALGSALAFDVFAQAMDEEDRARLVRKSDRYFNYLFLHSRSSEHRGDNSFWYSHPSANNWNGVINGSGLGTAAVSLLGHNRYAGQWLDQAIKTQKWFIENNFDADGAYSESIMYNSYGIGTQTAFLNALYEFMGTDLITYRNIIQNNANYMRYMLEPMGENWASFNDSEQWQWGRYHYMYVKPTLFLAASSLQDGTLNHLLRRLYGDLRSADRFHDYSTYVPLAVLQYKRVTDIEVDRWNISESKVWLESGKVSLRAGRFDNERSQFLPMECGYFGSHSAKDQSTFEYSALGQNFIDDNNYGQNESEDQNVILIDGLGQASGQMNESLGSIDAFFDGDILDFTTANATYAYQKNDIDVDVVERNIILKKEFNSSPGYAVLFDNLQSEQARTYLWGANVRHDNNPVFDVSQTDFGFQLLARANEELRIPNVHLDIHVHSSGGDITKNSTNARIEFSNSEPQQQQLYATLLMPYEAESEPLNVQKLQLNAVSGYQIDTDIILFSTNDIEEQVVGGLVFTGKLAAKFTANEMSSLHLHSGTAISDGQYHIQLSKPSSAELVQYSNGDYVLTFGNESDTAQELELYVEGLVNGEYLATQEDVAASSSRITIHHNRLRVKGNTKKSKILLTRLP